jgi:hypothetical protein
MKGDINQDGIINEEDVAELKKYIAGASDREIIERIGDLNGDGKVNSRDLTALKRIIKAIKGE